MEEVRKYNLSPSCVTSCSRGYYYERKKIEKPGICDEVRQTLDLFRTFADTGVAIQKSVTKHWVENGALVEAEDWLPDNPWNIKGKFDAICKVDGRMTLVEVKGAGDRAYNYYKQNNFILPAHRLQLMTYYMIMREEIPEINSKLLYVNRKTRKSFAIDMSFSEDDLADLVNQFEVMHEYLEKDILPEAALNIENYIITGKLAVSMKAITCRYHEMCTGDNNWYQNALSQIPQEVPVDISDYQ